MSTHAGYAKQIGHDVICRWRDREVEMYLPRKRDPFALPDRRFRRARFLVDHGMLPSPKWDDHWVRQAKDFLGESSRCGVAVNAPTRVQEQPRRTADDRRTGDFFRVADQPDAFDFVS